LIDVDQKFVAHFRTNAVPALLKPSDVQRALAAGLTTALDLNDTAKASSFLQALGSEPETSALDTAKGRLALAQNAVPDAKAFFEKAVGLDPESSEAVYWLAVAQRASGDNAAALSLISQLLQLHPQFLPALEEQMELAADRGDFQTALAAQLKRMALMPNAPAYEYGRLGALWLNTSNFTQAESVLLKGLAKDPYCYACHFELGELYIHTKQFPLARQNFEWVIRFFPDSDAAAFRSLVGIDLLLKDTKSAKAVLAEGLRLFPDDTGLLKARAALGG
jgi:tetratricopeptide (TPR) repeat protein